MSHILIYGVPDVGKTTLSQILRNKTGLKLVEGDYIRAPYPATKSAWREYGSLSKENAVKGLMYVRDYMRKDVDRVLAEHKEVILESVFIDPVQHHKNAKVFLLVKLDEATHRKQFFAERDETHESQENFMAIRMIQEFLLTEASELNVSIVHNDDTPEEVAKQFTDNLSS